MAEKYFSGKLPTARAADAMDEELLAMTGALRDKYEDKMEKYAFQSALAEVFAVIARANKYIDETAPWVLAKDEALLPRLASVLYNLLETVRICTTLLLPVMPDSCVKIFEQIGADESLRTWESAAVFGLLPAEAVVHKGENIFPRIDLAAELKALEEEEAAKNAPAAPLPAPKAEIDFGDFEKVDMTVCKILACENVKKSEKLLKFRLDDGSGSDRQILSGIAKYYKAEDLVGKTVVACTNLAPRKMMGQESNGMLLSAEKDGKLDLVLLDDSIAAGAKLC
ncbi:MAG: methionine--tRNA ligase subunit beta [Ruthenibacterium sp.]